MDTPGKVTFHYIKSPHFDEHPLHGVYGGITPHGISMAVFSERAPIPTEIDMAFVGADKNLTMQETEKRGKEGFVRLVHGVYHMDVGMAEVLRNWLDEKIEAMKAVQNAQ